ncbi:MAG TPA: sigma-54-dependent Fis family transcriptional regulator [Gemmatimonas aurantiaca]|uniref:Sigma-54-dependent Fis family transcriptional regulator n=2 Tax=Gemmatimonas aurantiaca TaxID=173480 RepID=A0A3D4V8C9_9BACT|nr:sigma-54 dependent transcriptional regulator [Gemmatimonas aurantiaca]BAH38208.1 putative NtrC family two-component response regulator [Gemmatimonas aurantiaca T-27]HCT56982.1 sigma-54-dependent Fis family transcriptional regulator [Gemmatimonas aurantiaca]
MTRRILVIDDEPGIRQALGQLLEYEGFDVRTASGGAEGITLYDSFRPQLVFLDVKMAGLDGLEVLKRLRQADPNATVVMISGHATIQTAVEATQLGAYDILEKPLDTDRVLVLLRNAFTNRQLTEENDRLRETIESRYEIVGRSFGIRSLLERIERVTGTPARVLITGENGTGKELVARAIHRGSQRARKPFIEVNCAAIPSELIESELFGHMKGSFTGAIADRAGKFEQAHGGTLFLDEIGDMSQSAQAKVLRVLQDGFVTRIGGSKPVQVDVRVLAATNKDLEEEIAAGRFREDLYYRLNVVPITVPALRERREDIPLLVRHFLQQFAERDGLPARSISDEALQRLSELDWPGNVRELRNTMERLVILASAASISVADIDRLAGRRTAEPSGIGSLLDCNTFEEFKQAAERAFLLAKLRAFDWNVSETARALDMPRSNLYKKIERYALTRESLPG